jgi:hypothetical protein
MSTAYLSQVSGFPSGLAGSCTVTPQITSGGDPTTAAGATVGAIVEKSTTPGTYLCLVTYTAGNLPLGTIPQGHWSVNGVVVDDVTMIPMNGCLEIPSDTYSIRQLLALMASRLLGVSAGLPAGPWTSESVGGFAPRTSMTFDAQGNLTAVTLTPPA